MQIPMPPPVRLYFESEAYDDTARVADCFAPDAVVTDERRTHIGLEAIRAWKTEAKAAASYRVTPVSVEPDGARVLVLGRVEGAFPGSPAMLRYHFDLRGERISKLEIRA
ncbi:MAG TPA: nuclear transport factor 2 family protein [Hyphomonas sp.]|nr:polyketide cyclase [Hyphomonas sp.]HRJ00975.1 nuclear transport factor 2 family protein [Hyphomonas sp.]HRK67698.1 nuclear transport factor 2 family protein [Hyphomonas sp.]